MAAVMQMERGMALALLIMAPNKCQTWNSSTSFETCFLLLLPPLLFSAITQVAEWACGTIETTFRVKETAGFAGPKSMSGWSNARKFFRSMWFGRMRPQWTSGLARAKDGTGRCWTGRYGWHESHRTDGANRVGSRWIQWIHISTRGGVGCWKHIGTLTPSTLISNDSQGTSSALWSPHGQRNLWNL